MGCSGPVFNLIFVAMLIFGTLALWKPFGYLSLLWTLLAASSYPFLRRRLVAVPCNCLIEGLAWATFFLPPLLGFLYLKNWFEAALWVLGGVCLLLIQLVPCGPPRRPPRRRWV